MKTHVLLFFVVILVIVVILSVFLMRIKEPFNSLQSKIALYDHPHECPFERLNLYRDPETNKIVISTKIKGHECPELSNVYDNLNDFRDAWTRTSSPLS